MEQQKIVIESKENFLQTLISFCLGLFLLTCWANFWYSIDGYKSHYLDIKPIANAIEVQYPSSKIISHNWQYFSESRFLIELPNKTKKTICLDSSIWFDYEFEDCN